MEDNKSKASEILRQRAEEILKKKPQKAGSQLSEADLLKLIHELEVYQLELEMQNEELIHSKEQAAILATEKYAELYDFAPSGYFTLSREAKIIELNLYGAQMLGHDRFLLKNRPFVSFISNDTKPIFNLFLDKIFTGKGKETCEIKLFSNNQLPVYIHLTGIAVENREQCFITGIDITERKHAEEALKENAFFLETLLNAIPAPVFYKDSDGRYTGFNKAFEQFYGDSAKDYIGKTVFDIAPRELAEIYNTSDKNLFEHPGVQFYDSQMKDSQGVMHDIAFHKATIIDSNGHLRGLIGLIIDITERKQAQEALQESEKRLAQIIDFLPDATFAIDLKGNIIAWNHAIEEMTGVKAEDMLGKGNFEYALPFYGTRRQLLIDLIFKPDKEISKKYYFVSKKGECLFMESEVLVKGKKLNLWGIARPLYDSKGQKAGAIESIRDITDRKYEEEKLRQSQERYSRIVDTANEGIWVLDEENVTIFVNLQIARILGYEAEEMIGKALEFFIFEEDLPDHKQRSKNRHQGVAEHYERRWRRKNGQAIWTIVSATPIMDAGHHFRGSFAMILDITERKLAEQALTENNIFLQTLLDAIPAPVYYKDTEGRYIGFNKAFEMFFGRTSQELAGKTFLEIGPHDLAEIYHAKDMEILQHPEVQVFDSQLKDSHGILHEVVYHKAAILDSGSRVRGLIGVIIDITERKQAEEALRRQAERLQNLHKTDQAILEAIESPESIVNTALQHLRDLLHCQHTCVGIIDKEKKKMQIFASDVHEKTILHTEKNLSEEAYRNLEILRHGKMEIVENVSGATAPSAVSCILQTERIGSFITLPLLSAQRLYGVLNIGWEGPKTISREESDIANEVANQITIAIEQTSLLKETKLYATNLEKRVSERTAQLEAANKELETFSYSVSHDLRAPLRHISGFINLFLERKSSHLTKEELGYLDIISKSADDMGTLIDALLYFSRLNRSDVRKTHIDTLLMINQGLQLFDTEIQSRSIEMKIGPLHETYGDLQLMGQVWINLISNAIKYTGKKDKAIIEIGSYVESDGTVFFIKDNGAGFNMKYSDKLFGLFQRLHKPSDFEGIGIGLANINRIITRHGGRCWAEGEMDKGATFYFRLPKEDTTLDA